MHDKFIRHAHFVERYKTGLFNRFKPFLDRVIADLTFELSKTNSVRSRKVLAKKIRDIEKMVTMHYSAFTDDFTAELDRFAGSEANFTLKAIGIDMDAPKPMLNRLRAAYFSRPFNNTLLKDALSDFVKQQAKMIRDAVSMGFFEGNTTPEIIKQVVGTSDLRFGNGVVNVSKIRASRLVRTAVTHVAAVAKDQVYKENADLVTGYEWVATLDSRTSDICRGLDGNQYELGKGPLAPAHPNCRSTTIPILIK